MAGEIVAVFGTKEHADLEDLQNFIARHEIVRGAWPIEMPMRLSLSLLFSARAALQMEFRECILFFMTFTGTVENGKVALPPEVKLPSGTKVRVETLENGPGEESIGARLQALDGIASRLPVDMAQNHDHYLHGKPKCSPL